MQDADELPVIIILLKDELTVDASEHHVVDACLARVSGMSWHISSGILLIICYFCECKVSSNFYICHSFFE